MEKTQKVIRRLFDQYLESIESVLDLKWMKNVSVFGLKQANIHNKKKFVYRNSFSFFLTRRRSSDTEILGIFKLICSFVNVYLVRIRMDCLFNNGVWIHLSQKHLDFFSFFLQHRSNGHGCSNSLSFSLYSPTHYTVQQTFLVSYIFWKWMTQQNDVLFEEKNTQYDALGLGLFAVEWTKWHDNRGKQQNSNEMFQRSFISNDTTNKSNMINMRQERDVYCPFGYGYNCI